MYTKLHREPDYVLNKVCLDKIGCAKMQDLINTSSCVSESSCKMAEEAMNEALNALATLQEKVCSFCFVTT